MSSVGTNSSIVSLSIVKDTPLSTPEVLWIGCIDIMLGALLEKCDESKCKLFVLIDMWHLIDFPKVTALEIPLMAAETGPPVMGTIMIKLSKLTLDDVVIHLDDVIKSYLHPFQLFGHLSDLENAISNQKMAVEITGDSHAANALYLTRSEEHTSELQ